MKFLCVEISENVKTYINISHIVNIFEFENNDIVYIYCINDNEPIKVSKQVLRDEILPYLDVRY